MTALKTSAAAVLLAVLGGGALAQASPVGLWRSIDDRSGEPKAEIRIAEQGGALSGRIERSLRKDAKPGAVCEECTDERKGRPIAGLEIIRGGARAEGKEVWENSRILDPENGKEYRATLTPVDGGAKLQVRGYLGPFWRTQTWLREE
jgi:uncharacterized protein (DUF2147 family)